MVALLRIPEEPPPWGHGPPPGGTAPADARFPVVRMCCPWHRGGATRGRIRPWGRLHPQAEPTRAGPGVQRGYESREPGSVAARPVQVAQALMADVLGSVPAQWDI